jgi:hypothetical protein
MKDKRHIKSFNEATENLNISDVSGSKVILYEYDTESLITEVIRRLGRGPLSTELDNLLDKILDYESKKQ